MSRLGLQVVGRVVAVVLAARELARRPVARVVALLAVEPALEFVELLTSGRVPRFRQRPDLARKYSMARHSSIARAPTRGHRVATASHQSSPEGWRVQQQEKNSSRRTRPARARVGTRLQRSQASRKLRRTKRVRTRPAGASRRTPARAAARTRPAPRPRATPS